MTRTEVNLDEELLAEAAEYLGTNTKAATVNAALDKALEMRRRQEFFDFPEAGGLPDLTGPIEHRHSTDVPGIA